MLDTRSGKWWTHFCLDPGVHSTANPTYCSMIALLIQTYRGL